MAGNASVRETVLIIHGKHVAFQAHNLPTHCPPKIRLLPSNHLH